MRGNIESPGAQDTFTFTAAKGRQVFFDAREYPSSGYVLSTVLRPDDEPVFQDESLCSDGSPSDKTVTLPQAGAYRLIVKGSEASTGTYRVNIQSR